MLKRLRHVSLNFLAHTLAALSNYLWRLQYDRRAWDRANENRAWREEEKAKTGPGKQQPLHPNYGRCEDF